MTGGRDTFLERLLAGELDERSEEARRLFMEHPDVRGELERLQRAERAVRSAGDEGRDILAEAERTEGAPGEDAVAALLERHFAGAQDDPAPPAPHASQLRWLVPLAAAAGIAFLLWARPFSAPGGGGSDPGPVMGVRLSDLRPEGAVEDFTEFTWRSEAAEHHYYRVFVYDPAAPEGSPEIDGSDELEEPRWTPNPNETKDWPREIRWEVVVYEDGNARASRSAAASRR